MKEENLERIVTRAAKINELKQHVTNLNTFGLEIKASSFQSFSFTSKKGINIPSTSFSTIKKLILAQLEKEIEELKVDLKIELKILIENL